MKIYYAHCIALYGTAQERRDLETIAKVFPGAELDNPNRPEVEAAYPTRGMDMFKEMAQGCDVLVFRGLADGSIPAGVAKEIEWALEAGRSVVELPCGITKRSLSVQVTREHLKECGHR